MSEPVTSGSNHSAVQKPAAPKFSFIGLLVKLIWLPGYLAARRKEKEQIGAKKSALDHELRLYSKILPNGYLHYGYFEQPDIKEDEISFAGLSRAQQAYADKLLAQVEDKSSPVFDVGCGMGGLSFQLFANGYKVVALTPDQHQAAHIRKREPDLPVFESTFEAFEETEESAQQFGTILTSESLQYLDLDVSIPKICRLLKDGGIWVACDYFRISEDCDTSGHLWTDFKERLAQHGLRIRYEEDITDNVMPTLRFATMLADRFMQPAWDYARGKILTKRPFLHYLLEDFFKVSDYKIARSLKSVDPELFKSQKRYILLVIERAA